MIISLLGYMGSGKTHISKILSKKLNFKNFDLDREISKSENMPISEIFTQKGEIYFRKVEREVLENALQSTESMVLSLGGGTPVYYDNIQLINQYSISFYLQASVMSLYERLKLQKDKRPLIRNIKDEDLPEFIAKHLFERNPYYSQAHHTIATDKKNPEFIIQDIIEYIYKK